MSIDIDALVQEVREKIRPRITSQCGIMQVLDMTQPLGLNDIYINVKILETILGRRQLGSAELVQGIDSSEFERHGLSRITEERVPGRLAVEKYSKLIVLGKPGIGKTTFLKYLAIQSSLEQFQADKVAIYVTLKDFAEAESQLSLLAYITQILGNCSVAERQTLELLKHGRAIILLDGLDEVREEDSRRVCHQVCHIYKNFPQNKFVLTCRIAGREYAFEDFTEVEIADFDEQQIASFATKWFAPKDSTKTQIFLQKLKQNAPIQELANTPLLLTLLCLIFEETETADFASNRAELYQEGLNVLLKKWDANKNIERDRIYKRLSLQHKENLLSQIAFITFKQGDYFFKQEKLEEYIADYISNSSGIGIKSPALQLDSKAVLKSMEVQHGLLVERALGIYSFSHLTFHEYFVAREIVTNSDPQALETALKELVSHITERRWREIFLLSVEMLRNADYLLQLMKQQIERIVEDDRLQAFLTWVNAKSQAVTVSYKPVAIRAFYLSLALTLDLVSAIDLDHALTLGGDTLEMAFSLDSTIAFGHTCPLDLNVDRALVLALARALDLKRVPKVEFGLARTLVPDLEVEAMKLPLGKALLTLQEQLPPPEQDRERFKQWWQANGEAWAEELRAVMISERNIGHNWQFSKQQRETLRQYCNANWLLLECLNSNCYVTRSVREEITESLLLPMKNLES